MNKDEKLFSTSHGYDMRDEQGCIRKMNAWLKRHRTTLQEWAANEREMNRQRNERMKIEKRIISGMGEDSAFDVVFRNYKVGENTGSFTARYSTWNGIDEHDTLDKYSGNCRFMKVTRSFEIRIRKGWSAKVIGGLLTFWHGRFDRNGIRCQWVEQGKAIDSFRTVDGWLVRGEHIEAGSLEEARKTNAAHRNALCESIRRQRAMNQRFELRSNEVVVTYNDSISAGNCRPGTDNFIQKVCAELGLETLDSMTGKEVRRYAKKYGVSTFAERAIRHAVNTTEKALAV